MATDGPTPAPCDPAIWNEGHAVLVSHSVPSNATERWVKKLAEQSEQPVDWSYMGGRIVVRALGDLDKVVETMREMKPEWTQIYLESNPDSHREVEKHGAPWMERWPIKEC
jgi:hypothetical protein